MTAAYDQECFRLPYEKILKTVVCDYCYTVPSLIYKCPSRYHLTLASIAPMSALSPPFIHWKIRHRCCK